MSSEIEILFEENFIKESITEFVRKVYLLLQDPKTQDIVHWDTDNKTVVIRDTKQLVDVILPVIFKQNTLKSFVRQLNMYNFKKIRKGFDRTVSQQTIQTEQNDDEDEEQNGNSNQNNNSKNHGNSSKEPSNSSTEPLYFRNQNFERGNLENLIFIKRKQRGYVEKSKLEHLQSKSTLEKYNTYTKGIIDRLVDEFDKISKNHPQVAQELHSVLRVNNPMPAPSMRELQANFTGNNFAGLLASMPSLLNLPGYRTFGSFLELNEE